MASDLKNAAILMMMVRFLTAIDTRLGLALVNSETPRRGRRRPLRKASYGAAGACSTLNMKRTTVRIATTMMETETRIDPQTYKEKEE